MEKPRIVFVSLLVMLAGFIGMGIVVQTAILIRDWRALPESRPTMAAAAATVAPPQPTFATIGTPIFSAAAAADTVAQPKPTFAATATLVFSATPSSTASPIPATSIPATATQSHFVHRITPGETLYKIGRRYQVSLTTIITLNRLENPNRLLVGQELLIPRPTGQGAVAVLVEEAPTQPTATPSTPTLPPPTPEPTPTIMPPPSPPPVDGSSTVNGIAHDRVAWMPDEVLANSRAIYGRGQEMGNNPRAFSLLGDSVIAPPFFRQYDVGNYDLGEYGYLEGVIDYFAGSFGRDSASLRIGLHSWTALDPMWADKSRCEANEGPLACELRLHNPSFLIIRLGSNDVGVPQLYESEMRRTVVFTLENDVIPILGTKADRHEGSNVNNEIVRRLAAEYQVPLWDFDLVAGTMPGRGLDVDGVHLNPDGRFLQNVSALVVLDRLWREIVHFGALE